MNVEHLRKIIAYSDKNREDIYSMVKRFCAFARIEYDSDFLNILQIVRSSIRARLQFDVGAFIMRKIVEIAKNRFRKREKSIKHNLPCGMSDGFSLIAIQF